MCKCSHDMVEKIHFESIDTVETVQWQYILSDIKITNVGLWVVLLCILSENETVKYKNMDIKPREQLYMIKVKHRSTLDLAFFNIRDLWNANNPKLII